MSRSSSFAVVGALTSLGASAQVVHAVIDGAPFELLSSIEAGGDFDGDGVEDLVLVRNRDASTLGPGSFQVLSGATLAPIGPSIAADPGSIAGHVVRAVGDFDGDGTPDVARLNEWSQPTWSVEVFSGATWTVIRRFIVDSEPTWGAELAHLGDFDGDGYSDVIIVEHPLDIGDLYTSRVHFGPNGSRTEVLNVGSGQSSNWMRYDFAGDMNGDGRADVLQFHYRYPTFGAMMGYALAGVASHTASGSFQSALVGRTGDYREGFGHHAAAIADINQDGIRDLAIGVPGPLDWSCCIPGRVDIAVSQGFGQPVARSLFGVDDGTPASHGSFGAWLDGSRDVDGDGTTDLLVAAPSANGQRGYVDAYKLPEFTLLWRVRPTGPDDQQVRRPVFVGDLDGDGASEWAIVDPWAQYGGTLAGRVWIYAGAQGLASSYCPASSHSGGRPAELRWLGPLAASHPEATLEVHDAPGHSLALVFFGDEGAPQPAGDGTLCLGGALRRLPVIPLDADGFGRLNLPAALASAGHAAWTAGSTWALQAVYRDALGLGSGFNTTNAWRLTLLP